MSDIKQLQTVSGKAVQALISNLRNFTASEDFLPGYRAVVVQTYTAGVGEGNVYVRECTFVVVEKTTGEHRSGTWHVGDEFVKLHESGRWEKMLASIKPELFYDLSLTGAGLLRAAYKSAGEQFSA